MEIFGPISINFPNFLMSRRWAGFQLGRQDLYSEPNHKHKVDAWPGIGICNQMLVPAATGVASK